MSTPPEIPAATNTEGPHASARVAAQDGASEPDPPRNHLVGLSFFAIPLGFAGIGGTWTAAELVLDAAAWVEDALFVVSAILWVGLTVVYVGERLRDRAAFRTDRQHPGNGAGAAFPPIIGILLTVHFGQYLPAAAPWVCGLFVVATAVVAAQLFAHWLGGEVAFAAVNPGYFLPLVAGPFIASIGLSTVKVPEYAMAALAVGAFFWIVIGSVVTTRLIVGGPLPHPVKPTLSVLLTPAATGGIAAFVVDPGHTGPLQYGFLGIYAVMLLVQIFLLREYRGLPFGIAYWTFAFPVAASANYVIRWLGSAPFNGSVAVAWGVLGLATAFVATITGATVLKGHERAVVRG